MIDDFERIFKYIFFYRKQFSLEEILELEIILQSKLNHQWIEASSHLFIFSFLKFLKWFRLVD